MKYKILFSVLLFTIVNELILSCTKKESPEIVGSWRAAINTDGGELPFHIEFLKKADSTSYEAFAINGAERLKLDDPIIKNDSILMSIEIFDAKIAAKIEGNKMTGQWERYVGAKKFIHSTFVAEKGIKERFKSESAEKVANVNGKWAVNFVSKDGKDITESVGLFDQVGNKVTGTFLTTTGDYRYLEGIVDGDSLKLSCFDGTHLFLFKAKKVGDQLNGQFWSNIHSLENWTANLDPKAALPDVNKLTYLKPGYSKVEFTFPDTQGKMVNINDKQFEGKVKIVQLMGTWCPNCMDETKYLAPWYDKNKNRGIEIIGLSYEKSTDLTVAGPKIDKMKQKLAMNYPVLLAGLKGGDEAAKSLPMLNDVLGFPTTIIIDKKGVVRNIHTGFSGPSTGVYYTEWSEDFNLMIDKLVAE
ncbi:MAG: TlpA disulfide reductase family protein [Bacteroidota bacterium]